MVKIIEFGFWDTLKIFMGIIICAFSLGGIVSILTRDYTEERK